MAIISLRAYNLEIEGMIDNAQLDEAVAHCRHILATFPKHIATYRLLGKAHLEQQRISDATDIFQRVLTAIPDDFVANVGMSIIREDENNLDAAIWHMELAYEAQPANMAIQDELRRLYGRRDGTQPPKVRLTRGALARMYAKGNLYDQAIGELQAAITEDPNRTDLQLLLAQMYYQTSQRVDAVETCVNILKKLPICLEANRILAVSLPETEDSDAVRNYRQTVVSMDPYFAFAEPEAISSDQVPESAVNIERLDWKSGVQVDEVPSQPSWATSLGISLEKSEDENIPDWLKSAEASAPPTSSASASSEASPFIWDTQEVEKIITETSKPEGELPEWMKDAGWQPASGEATPPTEEIKTAPLNADVPVNEELEQADIPNWLKGVAPDGVLGAEQASGEPKEDELSNPWLEPHQPGPTDSIIHWLEEEKPVRSDAGPAPVDDAAHILDDEVPDWLRDLDVPQASTASAAENPEADSTLSLETPGFVEQTPSPESVQAGTEASLPKTPGEPVADAAPAENAEEIPDWLREIAGELPSAGAFLTSEPTSSPEPAAAEEQPLSEQAVPSEERPAEGFPEASEEAPIEVQADLEVQEQSGIEATSLSEEVEAEQAQPVEEEMPEELQPTVDKIPASEQPQETEISVQAPGEGVSEELPEVETTTPEEHIPEAAPQVEASAVSEEITPAKEEVIPQKPQVEVAGMPEEAQELEPAASPEELATVEPAIPEEPIPETAPQAEAAAVSEEIAPAEGEAIPEPAQAQVAGTLEEVQEFEPVATPEELPAEQRPIPPEEARLEEAGPTEVEKPPEIEIPAVMEEQPTVEPPVLPGEEAAAEESLPEEGAEEFAWLEELAAEQNVAEESLIAPPEEGEISPPEWVKLEMEPTSEEIVPRPAQDAAVEAALPAEEIPEWIKGLGEGAETEPAEEVSKATSASGSEIPQSQELPAWLLDMEQPEPKKEPPAIPAEPLDWESEELPTWLKEMAESGEPEAAPAMPETAVAAEIPTLPMGEELATAEKAVPPSEQPIPEVTLEQPATEEVLPEVATGQQEAEELPLQVTLEQPAVEGVTPEATLEQPLAEELPSEAALEQPAAEQVEAVEGEQPVPPQEITPPETAMEAATMLEEVAPQSAGPGAPGIKAEVSSAVEEPTTSQQIVLIEARDTLVHRQPTQAARLYAGLIKQEYHLDEIVKDLQDALYSFPLNVDMWIALGDALHRTHDLQEALNAYTKAEELVR
jgi:cytochrome c-type biogenesis protein CcmH/NrfG